MPVNYTTVSCSECGFPISAKPGDLTKCPHCGILGKVSGPSISTSWVLAGIAFTAGLVVGAVLTSKSRVSK